MGLLLKNNPACSAAIMVVGLLLAAPGANGQAFNIDIGTSESALPSALYGGAADQPGHWHSWNGPLDAPLTDVAGNATAALMTCSGGIASRTFAGASADDSALMEDSAYSHGTLSESVVLRGLMPGRYRLFVYGWGGNYSRSNNEFAVFDSHTTKHTDFDLQFTQVWPGRQVMGETYFTYDFGIENSSNFVAVFMLTTGFPKDPYSSFVNGLQVVPIPAPASALPLVAVAAVARRRRSQA